MTYSPAASREAPLHPAGYITHTASPLHSLLQHHLTTNQMCNSVKCNTAVTYGDRRYKIKKEKRENNE